MTSRIPANLLINEARKQHDKGRVPGEFQRIARANTYSVSEVKAAMRLPHDYAYSDHKPKEVVNPAVLWGEIPTKAVNGSPREQFAAWVTSPDNPSSARTIANRIWKRFLGVGLVEPIDDFQDINPCSNEPLLEFLSQEIVRNDFDLKEFIRTILYSRTYQREASDYDPSSDQLYYFPGPVVRRMTAEQVWDSILTLAVRNSWPFQRPTAEEMAAVLDIDFATDDYTTVKAKSSGSRNRTSWATYKRALNAHAYQGNVLCRASELPSPLPAEHFHSTVRAGRPRDDQWIAARCDGSTDPGHVQRSDHSRDAGSRDQRLSTTCMGIDATRDRVDAIFLSVLTRGPQVELTDGSPPASFRRHARTTSATATSSGACLNTREFLFVQ